MTRSVATHCRICQALCGVVVDVDGDRVVGVRGDASDPLSKGYTCPKGRSLGSFHHDRRRYDGPMIRRDGELVQTTWNDVIGDLDARLRDIVDAHGPDAVGIYTATGSAFDINGRRAGDRWLRLMGSKSRYTSGGIDAPSKPLVAELVAGFAGVIPVLDPAARLVLFVGVNPVVSHGHLNSFPDPVTSIRRIRDEGTVWVIDPRRSATARHADRHLAPRPGTDWILLAHLVRSLLADGADHAYLAEHADGVADLEAAVAPFDAPTTAAATGLDPAEIADLLEAIRANGRVAGQTGTGVTMSPAANVTEWLLWSLHIVTHSFDVPGGMWFNPGYLRVMEQRSITPVDGSPGPGPRSRPDLPRRVDEYPVAAMYDEIDAGNLRALFVLGGNPITAFPEVDRTAKMLEQLDVLVLADVVANETTPYATHVFACADQLERADLPGFLDQLSSVVMTKYSAAVFEPKQDRRPMWWPFAALGGMWELDVLGGGLDPDSVGDDDLLRVLGDRSRSSFDEIVEKRVIVNDPPQIFGWVHEQILPDGRWRIAPPPLVAQLAELGRPNGLVLIPRRQVRHLNSQLTSGAAGRADEPDLLLHPEDAAASGIVDGDPVVVRSDHGATHARATVTDAIRPGAVSLPHGYADPNVGTLTSSQVGVDPLSGMVVLSGLPVVVEKVATQAVVDGR